MREDDADTRDAFRKFIQEGRAGGTNITAATINVPGFLPPIIAGISRAEGDIVAFLDDDAVPCPDWLERLDSHYAEPSVGGVGGRCINMEGTREVRYPAAKRVGRFRWFGRVIGNMYKDSVSANPINVDFFMGGNMSYRRSLLERVGVDLELNNYVAANYEVDLGLQIKALGYRLVYDPLARIKHFSAPKSLEGFSIRSPESVYWYSYNLQYITLKHSRGWKKFGGIVYGIFFGDRMGWGLAAALFDTIRERRFDWVREISPALAGKLRAIQTHIRKRGAAGATTSRPR